MIVQTRVNNAHAKTKHIARLEVRGEPAPAEFFAQADGIARKPPVPVLPDFFPRFNCARVGIVGAIRAGMRRPDWKKSSPVLIVRRSTQPMPITKAK